jgi:phytoene synthase
MVTHVNEWLNKLRDGSTGELRANELTEVLHKFRIPLWPMEIFARSMIYDIQNDGFSSIKAFLDYSQGASVAPASIFVHLCGLRKINGHFMEPIYDIREAATPCAIFSYLVHIIRDFQIDQESNLNYFADNLICKYGLKRQDLMEMANGGEIKSGFRKMIRDYMQFMDFYRQQTLSMIKKISPYVEPRYRLSLHIIFNLYLMIYERIDFEKGNFSTVELNPTADEIGERVYQTIITFQDN